MGESASATNPYNVNALDLSGAAVQNVQSMGSMPVRNIAGYQKHVVDGTPQVFVKHLASKDVVTNRVVHHAPVVHKTVHTHQLQNNVVHDKQIHHMSTFEKKFQQIPGREYMGTQQSVDHTTASPLMNYKSFNTLPYSGRGYESFNTQYPGF